jgi:hypothetical protein
MLIIALGISVVLTTVQHVCILNPICTGNGSAAQLLDYRCPKIF